MTIEKKSSQVLELIRKLSKEEKRAFKLYASTYELKSSTTVALFDILYDYTHGLPEEGELNENDIYKLIKKAALHQQYASTKNRLKNLLLDFLYEMNAKEDRMELIHRKCAVARVLWQRGLVKMAEDTLTEAERMAIEYELHTTRLEILHTKYLFTHHRPDRPEERQTLLTDIRKVIADYTEYTEAFHEAELIHSYHIRRLPMPDSLPGKEQLKERIQKSRSINTKHRLYLSLWMLSISSDPSVVTAAYSDEHIRMLEDNIKPEAQNIMTYFLACFQSMSPLMDARNTVGFLERIKKMEAKFLLYSRYLKMERYAYVLLNINHYKIMYHKLNKDRLAMTSAVTEAEMHFLKHYKLVNREGMTIYKHVLRNSYFYCGDYAKAEYWAQKAIGNDDASRIVLPGYIIELISVYELGYSVEAIRARIKKIRYYLTNKTDPKQAELLESLIQSIQALVSARGPVEKRDEIQRMHDLFHSTVALGDPAINTILRNSYLGDWLEDKLG